MVAPLEMDAAENNAYRNPSGIGDLLGLTGRGVTLAGATGWSPFGGDKPTWLGTVLNHGRATANMGDWSNLGAARANPFWQYGSLTR